MAQQSYLTRDQLARVAPSVFQAEAHTRTSNRYTYIPTIDVVRGLESEGWLVTNATEQRVRDSSREGFQKHLLRFRHRDHMGPAIVGAEVPEIVLVNSHDGSSTYQIDAGLFRFICTNGMVVASSQIETQRVRHSGDVVSKVIEGVYHIVDQVPAVLDQIEQSKHLALTGPEQAIFARAAMALRWDDPDESGFTPDQVNRARRREDVAPDLWTSFNRVQENLVRGGLQGSRIDANGRRQRTTSREVKGIDQSVGLNRALWTLTEEMRKLKAA